MPPAAVKLCIYFVSAELVGVAKPVFDFRSGTRITYLLATLVTPDLVYF